MRNMQSGRKRRLNARNARMNVKKWSENNVRRRRRREKRSLNETNLTMREGTMKRRSAESKRPRKRTNGAKQNGRRKNGGNLPEALLQRHQSTSLAPLLRSQRKILKRTGVMLQIPKKQK